MRTLVNCVMGTLAVAVALGALWLIWTQMDVMHGWDDMGKRDQLVSARLLAFGMCAFAFAITLYVLYGRLGGGNRRR